MNIILSPQVSQAYPGACCGFLAVALPGIPPASVELDARTAALESELRAQYPDDASLKADPVLQAYAAYYKRFKKTYHVTAQLESVAQKGRTIPSVTPLVECMFMAELQDRLLTAGHDLAVINAARGEVTVEVARGDETYTLMRGTEQQLKAGDLYMHDGQGIISDIIYGPDQRSQITPETTAALFCVYGVPGVGKERVKAHLERIRDYARVASKDTQVLLIEVLAGE